MCVYIYIIIAIDLHKTKIRESTQINIFFFTKDLYEFEISHY